jgi:LacI family transcriptional regulator
MLPNGSRVVNNMPQSFRTRPATISDVAELAGVSIKTVSRVLNNEPYVNVITKDAVSAAALQLNYVPHPSARNLARSTSLTIGLVYSAAIDGTAAIIPHYSQGIQAGTLEACKRLGFGILLLPYHRDELGLPEKIVTQARQRRVSGLLITAPICNLPGVLQAILKAELPSVCIGLNEPTEQIPTVDVNNFESSLKMTRHLLSLGHRRIAFVKGFFAALDGSDRLAGFKKAMEEAGIPVECDLVVQGDHSFESGVKCGEQLLSLSVPPTAVFANNDDMAAGVMHSAYRRGMKLPENLSVVGFDDSEVARTIWPQLTTVHQPLIEMAEAATEKLVQMLRPNDDKSAVKPNRQQFQCDLVIRGSAVSR